MKGPGSNIEHGSGISMPPPEQLSSMVDPKAPISGPVVPGSKQQRVKFATGSKQPRVKLGDEETPGGVFLTEKEAREQDLRDTLGSGPMSHVQR